MDRSLRREGPYLLLSITRDAPGKRIDPSETCVQGKGLVATVTSLLWLRPRMSSMACLGGGESMLQSYDALKKSEEKRE